MIRVCHIKGCKELNPPVARYCRKCGTPLFSKSYEYYVALIWVYIRKCGEMIRISGRYLWGFCVDMFYSISQKKEPQLHTLEQFYYLQLRPTTLIKIESTSKHKRICLWLFIVWSISWFFLFFEEVIYELTSLIAIPSEYVFLFVRLLIIVLGCAWLLWSSRYIRKTIFFKCNAEYLENSCFSGKLKRIIKNKQVGLYDSEKKKVVLFCLYDKIEKLDKDHLLLEKDNKAGIYSLEYRKVILTPKYSRIHPFKDSITEVYKGNEKYYIDIKGNFLK